MNAHKNDNFSERLTTAADARSATLARFRARPKPDSAAVLERQAVQQAISVARDARIAERKAAREAEAARQAAEQTARAAEESARAAEASASLAAQAVEQKAARDARYAARKGRRR